jgi:hypothetical protein
MSIEIITSSRKKVTKKGSEGDKKGPLVDKERF